MFFPKKSGSISGISRRAVGFVTSCQKIELCAVLPVYSENFALPVTWPSGKENIEQLLATRCFPEGRKILFIASLLSARFYRPL